MKVDVTQEADVKALFERAAQEFGRVDIVVPTPPS
jgi:NAD(P)-dependent dehydrogenase (short-subunit alcohol dehydrogenase family)